MNISKLGVGELIIAAILTMVWLYNIMLKERSQESPTGGLTIIILITLMLVLGGITTMMQTYVPHAILIIGAALLAIFGVTADMCLYTNVPLMQWLARQWRAVYASLGIIISGVAIVIARNSVGGDANLHKSMYLFQAIGICLILPMIWSWIVPKKSDTMSIQAPPVAKI